VAKAVTAEFKEVQSRKANKKAILQVKYKRRYWTGSAYSYEAAWRTLEARDFGSIGEIQWSLDEPFLNKFKASNVSLFLNNADNQFVPTLNAPSFFEADAIATAGYDPMQTLFQVAWGYVLDDGSKEFTGLFTGLATEYILSGSGAEVEVIVTGKEYLLESAEAAKVSNTFTQEATSPATGDSNELVFYTTSTGVGRVTEVRVGGVIQDQGTDYKIEDLDEYNVPAKITFTSPPPTGQAVDATGIKWLTNQKIEDLVELLLDEAGVVDRNVQPVSFPAGVGGRRIWDTKADWDAGTVDPELDTTTEDGSVILNGLSIFDDFNDLSFSDGSPRTWTSPFVGSYTASPGYLSNSGQFQNSLATPATQIVGTWECSMNFTPGAMEQFWLPIFTGSDINGGGGYGISIRNSVVGTSVFFVRQSGQVSTSLINFGLNTPSGWHTYRITRTAAGVFNVYFDGVFKGNVTDNTYTSSAYHMVWRKGGYAGITARWDTIRTSPRVIQGANEFEATGQQVTDAHDTGVGNPQTWGKLDRFETLDGDSTITYETRTSVDGFAWDAWLPIAIDGTINSAVKRYIQVRSTLTRSTDGLSTPHLERLVANFTIGNVVVVLANHGSEVSVFDMIEVYANIADYEIGFEGDGTFFFRAKTVAGAPVLELTQENGIASIDEYRMGYDRVINVGQVKYGAYFNEYDGEAAGEASPTSEERFGRLIRQEDLSGILLANDVNLAAARARSIYENNFLPRRRVRATCKMIPHLDLSDIVRISYFDHPLFRETIWGDPLQGWAGEQPGFADPQNVLARDLDFKVIGLRFNPEDASCDLTLQEVLA